MFKKVIIILILGFQIFLSPAQEKIKNVIIMIPDGASISLVSLSRYYQQWLTDNPDTSLAIDPYICGLVRSTCSNAPIGDSAPTGSCYATGQPALKGNISIYPPTTFQDLYFIDSSKAYQPLTTLLECARLHHKSTGLVVTCEFSHATPASFTSHYYDRGAEDIITKQMVHNGIDVVLGGGQKYLKPHYDYLKSKDYEIYTSKNQLLDSKASRYWGVFGNVEMPYRIDLGSENVPTILEMTQKAIETLSQNENGFFLLVEGSLVDWALHNQDAKTAMLEFLEFNKAVDYAIRFAMKDSTTLVVILPDHGTSGISMGNKNSNIGYYKKSLSQFFEPLEIQKKSLNLDPLMRRKLSKTSLIGFTTLGHTGEDLFLAIYHPFNRPLTGYVRNIDINPYICNELGWNGTLQVMTDTLFVPHQKLYPELIPVIDDQNKLSPTLTFHDKGKTITYFGNTNYAIIDGKKVEFQSIIIYIDQNRTFYIPKQKFL